MNLSRLEIKQERDANQNSLSVEDTRLDDILQNFVDNVIKMALHEISDNLQVMEIKAKVSSLRLSPGKRSRQDFLDDTTKLCTPLVIFNDASQMERTTVQTVIKTPIQKVVDFSDPEQRHLWDKENYDPNTKQYSTDRKKKKVKGLSDNENKTAFRMPLEDITKKGKVDINSDFFSGSSRFIIRRSPKTSPKKSNGRKSESTTKSVSLLRMR